MKTNERGITPEKAQQILKERGLDLSMTDAALALDLLYSLAILEVNQNNKNEDENRGSVCSGEH